MQARPWGVGFFLSYIPLNKTHWYINLIRPSLYNNGLLDVVRPRCGG